MENVDHTLVEIVDQGNLDKLIAQQQGDQTLKMYWEMAKLNNGGMFVRNCVLYHRDKVCEYNVEQLCVPTGRRDEVMRLAHQRLTGGHLKAQKTPELIRWSHFWPNMCKDILRYCQSCIP